MFVLTIAQKLSNSGSIYDLASDMFPRKIRFRKGERYAVLLPSFYNVAQRAAQDIEAAIAKFYRFVNAGYYGTRIIDRKGRVLEPFGKRLVETGETLNLENN